MSWPRSFWLFRQFSHFFVLSSYDSSLSRRDRSLFVWPVRDVSVCVCVCVCVCVNWGRNGRREVHHFLFFLILRNKNKMGGDDENDVTNLFWRAFDAIYSLLLSRSLLLQRARLHHQVWPMSGSDLGSLFSLRQKWVWSKALLRGDRWKFTKSLDCSVTHLCFSFLAAGLQWLVKKRWKNS